MRKTELTPWRIAVISTDYDLRRYRRAVIAHLRAHGFDVLAFEEPDYPKEPLEFSHKVCRDAVQYADIVVLILNKRYGGWYMNRPRTISITHEEYREAVRLKKIVIPCVTKQLWNERRRISKLAKDIDGDDPASRIREYVATYPDCIKYGSVEVLLFLEEIHRSHANFIEFTTSPSDLCERLNGTLIGYSRYIAQMIVEEQAQRVERTCTSGISELRLGGTANSSIFIDPPFINWGPTRDHRHPSAVQGLRAIVQRDSKALITGGPGVGKSTLLARLFLEEVHKVRRARRKTNILPFFVSLRGAGRDYSFHFRSYIEQQLALGNRRMYPLFDPALIRPHLYVDGLDEISGRFDRFDLTELADSGLLTYPTISCIRNSALDSLGSCPDGLAGAFDAVFCLQNWTSETTVALVEALCRAYGRLDLQPVLKSYASNEMGGFLNSPLLVTMLFFVAHRAGVDATLHIREGAELFRVFLDALSLREVSRTGRSVRWQRGANRELLQAWEWAAWELYRHRSQGNRLLLHQLVDLVALRDVIRRGLLESDAFSCLLDIRPHTHEVAGMVHEQFIEYLVAKLFAHSCAVASRSVVEEYLRLNIRYRMNAFIKSIWDHEDQDVLQASMDFLWSLFEEGVQLEGEHGVPQCVNAIYYLSYSRHRLRDQSKERLWIAARTATDTYTRNSALFGLVRLGDLDAERALYEDLITSDEADGVNRGAHLVYFRDWQTSDFPPHYDDGSCDWQLSYTGLLNHVLDTSERFVFSKRIDIWTIRSLMLARKVRGPVKDEHIDQMAASLGMNRQLWPVYGLLLDAADLELEKLRAEWQDLPDHDEQHRSQ